MRPDSRGGTCDNGPLPDGSCCLSATPCLPRATPKRMFSVAWKLSALLAVGLAVGILFSKSGLSVGDVASAHAPFGDDCATCHTNFNDPPMNWIGDALWVGEPEIDEKIGDARLLGQVGVKINAACLECHRQGKTGLLVHGIDYKSISESTLQAESAGQDPTLRSILVDALVKEEVREHKAIGCVDCHREHEGRKSGAISLTDDQCQSCHASRFDGYENHPDFLEYPHHARPRIVFDHEKHFRLHFPEEAEKGVVPPDSCSVCHRSDTAGNMFVNGGFSACASCHSEGIGGSSASPDFLKFLSPPGLDAEALEDRAIGEWPEYAEDELGPFLMLVLESGGYLEKGDVEALEELDLLDLYDAPEEDLQAASRLAWAFKAMLRDLLDRGPEVFVVSARNLHEGGGPELAWTDLAASMPYAIARDAATQWYPNLRAELDAREAGEEVATELFEHEFDEGEADIGAWTKHGGWMLGDLALLYRPTRHADRFMHGWMAFASAPGARAQRLLGLLADESTPGSCAKCHVTGESDSYEVNWIAHGSETTNARPFADFNPMAGTNPMEWARIKPFSHFSHQQAIADDGCQSCHKPSAKKGVRFDPVSVEDCAGCHRQETGLSTCATCHNYHFRIFDDEANRVGSKFAVRQP